MAKRKAYVLDYEGRVSFWSHTHCIKRFAAQTCTVMQAICRARGMPEVIELKIDSYLNIIPMDLDHQTAWRTFKEENPRPWSRSTANKALSMTRTMDPDNRLGLRREAERLALPMHRWQWNEEE
jgi:hypothetical protein